jgi:hypothetical protein
VGVAGARPLAHHGMGDCREIGPHFFVDLISIRSYNDLHTEEMEMKKSYYLISSDGMINVSIGPFMSVLSVLNHIEVCTEIREQYGSKFDNAIVDSEFLKQIHVQDALSPDEDIEFAKCGDWWE